VTRPHLTPLDAAWLALLGHVEALHDLAAIVRAAGHGRARPGQDQARRRAAAALAALGLDRWAAASAAASAFFVFSCGASVRIFCSQRPPTTRDSTHRRFDSRQKTDQPRGSFTLASCWRAKFPRSPAGSVHRAARRGYTHAAWGRMGGALRPGRPRMHRPGPPTRPSASPASGAPSPPGAPWRSTTSLPVP
jgi:hypothetical protein